MKNWLSDDPQQFIWHFLNSSPTPLPHIGLSLWWVVRWRMFSSSWLVSLSPGWLDNVIFCQLLLNCWVICEKVFPMRWPAKTDVDMQEGCQIRNYETYNRRARVLFKSVSWSFWEFLLNTWMVPCFILLLQEFPGFFTESPWLYLDDSLSCFEHKFTPWFLSSANEVSTGPTCQFLWFRLSVFPCFRVSGLFLRYL